jgi:ubiquitin-protein ligase E3 A
VVFIKIINSEFFSDRNGVPFTLFPGAVKLLKILYYASAVGGRWDAGISSATTHAAGDDPGSYQLSDNDELEDLQDFINHPLFNQLFEPSNRRRRGNWVDPLQDALKIRPFDCREPLVSPDDFINEPLSEIIEMDKDFINYRTTLDGEPSFAFMLYPFVLTPVVKHRAMYFDNRIRMMSERRTAVLQRLIGEPTSHPYLRLHVRRDHLIEDALLNVRFAINFIMY